MGKGEWMTMKKKKRIGDVWLTAFKRTCKNQKLKECKSTLKGKLA